MYDRFINSLSHNVDYIVIGSNVMIFVVVGKRWLLMSLFFWVISTSFDMSIGVLKSKYITNNYDSRIFGRSLIKRTFILLLGLLLTLISRHLAIFFESDLMLLLSAFPIGYFHLFTLQELSSIIEHGKGIDPDDFGINILKKGSNGVKSIIVKAVDKWAEKFVSLYDVLSPKKKININR